MQPVANTPEILYFKVTNKHLDDVWVQWAIDMLEAGFDTEHLRILAGETKPFNYWYLQPLTDRVFSELGIDVSDVAGITHTYICFIIGEALSGKKAMRLFCTYCTTFRTKNVRMKIYLIFTCCIMQCKTCSMMKTSTIGAMPIVIT